MASDINLRFNNAQAMNGTDTTVLSTDWIDFKVAQDIAGGHEPTVEIIPTTVGAGAGTVRFELLAVDLAGANGVPLDSTPPLTPSTLVPATANAGGAPIVTGARLLLRVSGKPQALPGATLTHLRVRAVMVGAVTGLAVSSQLVPEANTSHPNKAYAVGY